MATPLILDNGFFSQWVRLGIGARWLREFLESHRLRAGQIPNLIAHAHLHFFFFSIAEYFSPLVGPLQKHPPCGIEQLAATHYLYRHDPVLL